jgi:hypothetical protein
MTKEMEYLVASILLVLFGSGITELNTVLGLCTLAIVTIEFRHTVLPLPHKVSTPTRHMMQNPKLFPAQDKKAVPEDITIFFD